jgi:hypothetical protein
VKTRHRGVVAIDPGKRTGWAVFVDGSLALAGVWPEVDMLNGALPMVGIAPAVAVIERPVIYPLGKSNSDPEDIVRLAIFAGDVRGYYRRAGLDTVLVKPRAWKGTVPKAIHGKRILGALAPEETALLPRRPRARSYDHNMLDAVGLGLWQLSKEGQRP